MQVLGLDVGNGKVKCCWINWQGSWENSQIVWDSLPLPNSQNRRQDFESGLPFQLLNFSEDQAISFKQIKQIVSCCSHSFSYQPYSESIKHLGLILQDFFSEHSPQLVRADGSLTPVNQLNSLSEHELYAYTFTNFYGSALLGSRLINNGLSLDLGTTTLDIIPIIKGQIDPAGLAKPADYLRYRYSHGRIHWLGLTIIPLSALASHVPVGDQLFQTVPRPYHSDLLFAYNNQDSELLQRHAYGQRFPDAITSRQRLAQFIGLDDQIASEAEIQQVRDFLYDRLLNRVATEIAAVAKNNFEQPLNQIPIASFALGESLVLKPALIQAGFNPELIKTLPLGREQELWSASSAFAMALLALEQELGHPVALESASPKPGI